jgi:hypothetical protein
MRHALVVLGCCVFLVVKVSEVRPAVPVEGNLKQEESAAPTSAGLEASCEIPQVEWPPSPIQWRWIASSYLRCAEAFIEEALNQPVEGADGMVQISRDELKSLRNLLVQARHAAFRTTF